MANEIAKIHQEVFDLLISYHDKDPDFLFTLRKINRKSRLDKGYWFLGDDHYLTVSFWRGRDWVTKMPNISFTIKANGETYLELNAKSISGKTDFFLEDFIAEIGAEAMDFNYGFYKIYSQFKPEEYLKSLQNFLKYDKMIIDRAIIEARVFWPGDLEYTEEIGPIWLGDFRKTLDNIKKYQKKLQAKETTTGFLRYITVKDFGPISNLSITDIPEGCRWVFLTGENGAGKTTLLKAIATGICSNVDNGERIWVDSKAFTINLGLDSALRINDYVISGSDDIMGKRWLPKGIAVYGPIRLFTQGNLDERFFNIDNEEINKRATFSLFNSIGILRDLSVAIKLTGKPKYHQETVGVLIENLIQNLEYILPNISKISQEERDGGTLLLYHQKGAENFDGVPFNLLPSGTKNIAAIILDLLIRFHEQQPNVVDIADYNGIVLIDEIDLHLHPKLQKELVIQLADTFPNIQFIVTTHSPIPLLGAPQNSFFATIYKDDTQNICAEHIPIDVSDLLPNNILSSPIFDFDQISSINHNDHERFITEDNYDDVLFYKILEKKIKERTLEKQKP